MAVEIPGSICRSKYVIRLTYNKQEAIVQTRALTEGMMFDER